MTVQDVKKALEICSEDDGCRECPYYDYHRCDKALLKDALALINEQQYYGGKLPKTSVIQYGDAVVDYVLKQQQEDYDKNVKVDVLNKVKSLAVYDDNYLDGYVFISDIDELIEEVQNGKDKG